MEWTGIAYRDDAADEQKVPHEILALGEPRVPDLERARVRVQEVRVKQETQSAPGDQEVAPYAPNLGREGEDLFVPEDEPVRRKDAEEDGERGHKSCGRDSPREGQRDIQAIVGEVKAYLAMGGARQ